MADWGSPVSGSQWSMSAGGPLVVPGSSANTKGNWVTLATLGRSGLLTVAPGWGQNTTSHRRMYFDLAIESGNEKTFIENMMFAYSQVGTNASRAHVCEVTIPITLPEGAVVRARAQSSLGSFPGAYLSLTSAYNCPSSWTGSSVDTYGAVPASTFGTTITASNTSFVFGAYSEITASCNRMECFFVALTSQFSQTAHADQDGWWQLAVGPTGSEQIIASGTVQAGTATQLTAPQWFGPFYQPIAEGQRLSARLSRQWDSSSQRSLGMIVYGVR